MGSNDIVCHVSPSVLDKFCDMLNADELWETFYGESETPAYTIDEYREKCEQELRDVVNGVERESSRPADLGTCLNEAVDCILLNVRSTRDDVVLVSGTEEKTGQKAIMAKKGDNAFWFHTEDVVNLASHVAGYTPQAMVSTNVDTGEGYVQVYGLPDYYSSEQNMVVDLKTTKSYTYGKFRYKNQRWVYPLILNNCGLIRGTTMQMTFLVCKVTGDNTRNPFVELEMVKEDYTDTIYDCEKHVASVARQFSDWYRMEMEAGRCTDRLKGERKMNR